MRLFFAAALAVLTADLVSKVLVVARIDPTDPGVRLLGGAVYLVQARNSGAAFSVGTGATVVLTGISIIVIAIVLRAARRLTSPGWALALGLVLGGAMGNLVDRLFRAPSPGKGHVVDWISVLSSDGHVWPIFNVADSAIVGGAALAVLLSLRGVELGSASGERPSAEPQPAGESLRPGESLPAGESRPAADPRVAGEPRPVPGPPPSEPGPDRPGAERPSHD